MKDGKSGIDGLNLASLLSEDGAGIDLSAKKDCQVFSGVLVYAAIDLRNCCVRQRFRAGVRNNADDQGAGWLGRVQRLTGIQVQTDTFTKRVLVWSVGPSCGFIDYRNLGRKLKVLVAEEASAQQQDRFLGRGSVDILTGIVRARQPGVNGHDAVRIETGLHLEQVRKAAQQKARSDH